MGGGRTVLLVEADAAERERLGDALEQAGWAVIGCPGPTGPDYTCIGGREGYCPLLEHADAVVLDLWLAGDEVGVGTPAEDLLELYVRGGRPVVAIGPGGWLADPVDEERVVRLPRRPDASVVTGVLEKLPAAIGFVHRGPAGPEES